MNIGLMEEVIGGENTRSWRLRNETFKLLKISDKIKIEERNDQMNRLKPLNDFIFKKVFGEEETKDNLIALLNAILSKNDREKLITLEIVKNKELVQNL